MSRWFVLESTSFVCTRADFSYFRGDASSTCVFFKVSTLPFLPSAVMWSLFFDFWAPQANSGHRSDTPYLKNTIFSNDFASFLVCQIQDPRVLFKNHVF